MGIDYSAFAHPKGQPRVLHKRALKLERERQLREAKRFVRQRDGGKCKCCGKAGAEVHHLLYRSLGGDHDPNNLALLCQRCHEDIHAHLIEVRFGGRNRARTVRFARKERT
jgi:5-methylcytosine-specific restriction endonuclease McrA